MLHDPPPPTPEPEPATVVIEPPADDLALAYPEFTREFLAWGERVAGQLPAPCVVRFQKAIFPDKPEVCFDFSEDGLGLNGFGLSYILNAEAFITFPSSSNEQSWANPSRIWRDYRRAIDRRNIHNESP